MNYKLLQGNNLELLKNLESNSIDSVVTDPPYGLSFMNKKWDYDVPSIEFWKEVYRVLKPGGHILSFGGTRTYHRLVVNIEDAGFEIRDQIQWIYGSGFPKSLNIGKAIDKMEGNEREVKGYDICGDRTNQKGNWGLKQGEYEITKGNSEWEGWGTALKPANEPICVARKPLSEKSVAENVLKWKTGGLNIDRCRIGNEVRNNGKSLRDIRGIGLDASISSKRERLVREESIVEGRFPANVILECICDEMIKYGGGRGTNITETGGYTGDTGDIHTNPNCPCRIMDEQSGFSKSQSGITITEITNKDANWFRGNNSDIEERWGFGDKGGASRFFYNAKVSKSERNEGLDGFEDKDSSCNLGQQGGLPKAKSEYKVKNSHPTVKPVNLMAYLCRLITPPNGIILDPFVGSGSTGIAALLEGFNFIGMEMDEEYIKIAEGRISNYEQYRKFLK